MEAARGFWGGCGLPKCIESYQVSHSSRVSQYPWRVSWETGGDTKMPEFCLCFCSQLNRTFKLRFVLWRRQIIIEILMLPTAADLSLELNSIRVHAWRDDVSFHVHLGFIFAITACGRNLQCLWASSFWKLCRMQIYCSNTFLDLHSIKIGVWCISVNMTI